MSVPCARSSSPHSDSWTKRGWKFVGGSRDYAGIGGLLQWQFLVQKGPDLFRKPFVALGIEVQFVFNK